MKTSNAKLTATTWIIASISVFVLAGLFAAGKGALLRIGLPAAASLVALPLYFRKPAAYFEFALWTWFLTPFARRVIDWRVGFADQNLALLTPFLVSWISILAFRHRAHFNRLHIAPFVLCGTGIAYGFFVGMAIHPSGEVIYGLVNWLSPMLLGLHVYVYWEDFEEHSAVIQRAAMWGLLLMGIYGIYQFYRPPAWDTEWLENLPGGLESSTFGRPEAQAIRVWSTLNAPGPFATAMVALLFLVTPRKSILKIPAVAAGLYAVMLSLVRTAWLTGVVGALYLAKNSSRKLFVRLVFAMGAGVIGLILLSNSSLDIPILQDRMKTLGDLKDDESVNDRMRLYTGLSGEVLAQPLGIGLNNSDFYKGYPLDSGPIRMLLNLGWFGTFIYSVGVTQIVWMMYAAKSKQNPFLAVSTTIVTTFLLQLASGLVLIGSSGAMFWVAIGSGLASMLRQDTLTAQRIQSSLQSLEPTTLGSPAMTSARLASNYAGRRLSSWESSR